MKFLKETPFVSQSRRGEVLSEVGCGVASLMMLLKYHNEWIEAPSYQILAKELGAERKPSEKGLRDGDGRGVGVYRRDVERWLTGNLQSSGKEIRFTKWVRNSRNNLDFDESAVLPAMVEMNSEWCPPCGHWIVCIKITKHFVEYLDPSDGRRKHRTMSRKVFSDGWYGNAISIISPSRTNR